MAGNEIHRINGSNAARGRENSANINESLNQNNQGLHPGVQQLDHLNPYMENWNYMMNANDLTYIEPGNNVMLQIQYQQDIHPQESYNYYDPKSMNNVNQPHDNHLNNHSKSHDLDSQRNMNHISMNAHDKGGESLKTGAAANVYPFSPPRPKQRRPCDYCRRRKTKCVIEPGSNNCVQCKSKNTACTYNNNASKRKLNDESQPSINKRHMSNVPIREIDPIQDYSTINNSLLKQSLSLQFPRSSFYIGPSSHLYDANLINLIMDDNQASKVEQVNLSKSLSLRKVDQNVHFLLKDDQSTKSFNQMSNDVDLIEKFVAPHGSTLIDLYFRIVHPSYPILHKKVFLEKYNRTHREFSAPLLAAVYVLAIQWWNYDPKLSKYPKPNVDMILKMGLNIYLLEILKRPKLSAVQAGLLLLQCKHSLLVKSPDQEEATDLSAIPDESDYSDWVLCSQVVALAEELGLGLDCETWKLPKWERGLRKRLAWAVYMEDKWLSLKHARPSHIHDVNWEVQLLIEEDFPEKHGDGDLREGSIDNENGKNIFTNFIELSKILSEILTLCYSFKAMKELQGVEEVLEIAKPLQFKLRGWYRNLPLELQMQSVQTRKLCSNGYLHLAYFATELTLHRKLFTMIYEQNMNGNPAPKVLTDACRQAARTRLLASIDFVRELKPEHIHSFWHSSSSASFTLIGTFAAILFMSAVSKEDSDFYRDQIFNYRWILKISSKGFGQVGEALDQLDLIYKKIPGLLVDGELLSVDQNFSYPQNMSAQASQYSNPGSQGITAEASLSNHNSNQNSDTFSNNSRVQDTSSMSQTNQTSFTQSKDTLDNSKLQPPNGKSPYKTDSSQNTSTHSLKSDE